MPNDGIKGRRVFEVGADRFDGDSVPDAGVWPADSVEAEKEAGSRGDADN